MYVEGPERSSPADAPRRAPAFVAGSELAAQRAVVEATEAELLAIDETAAIELAAVRAEHDEALTRSRDEYPRRLRFPCRLDEVAFGPPFAKSRRCGTRGGSRTCAHARRRPPRSTSCGRADRRFGRKGLGSSLVFYEVFDDGL